MREMNKPLTPGLALLTLLATAGCYDFDDALQQCAREGRCTLPDGGPLPEADGGDGGDGGQLDGGDGGQLDGGDGGCAPGTPDLPDDNGVDSNCDGIDGDALDAIFVDPVMGNDSVGTQGTRQAPLRSLGVAVARAFSRGYSSIYIAQGTYNEATFLLELPVSMYGGYTGRTGQWTRDGGSALLDGGPIGFTLRDVSADPATPLVIERLDIASAPAASPGAPSIGMRVVNANGIVLRYVNVTAGTGAQGPSGMTPAPAAAGSPGSPGNNATTATTTLLAGGMGAPLTCGDEVLGGGGQGGASNPNEHGRIGVAGQPGNVGGGDGGSLGAFNCGAPTCRGGPGSNGQDGGVGPPGLPGDAGDNLGMLEGETWVASSAAAGGPGNPGTSGGGGGGGGFCFTGTTTAGDGPAGSGGGGGSGGCGGPGGSGGGGGGASIGLLLVNGGVQLEHVTVRTLGGGRGGAGAAGADGGAGGTGNTGGTGASYLGGCIGGSGGNGGNGGPGGRGGYGGNGGGGPSITIWCNSSATSSVLGLEDGGTQLLPGAGGAPGQGAGSPANAGFTQPVYGCQ